MNEGNRNAFAGRNIELLIQNSIADHIDVIEKIKEYFRIDSNFLNTAGGGIVGEKSDVRINFTSGHYVDANIKGFRESAGFNQLTRTTVAKFCETFGIESKDKEDLERIVVAKSKNPKNSLFSLEDQEKWGKIFRSKAKEMVKWGFSKKPSREVLILYNRDTEIVKIYPMREVLKRLPTELTFTRGGFNIGSCISFQRKGGNGSLSKHIPKTTIKHPGNNLQLKIKVNELIKTLENVLIAEYSSI